MAFHAFEVVMIHGGDKDKMHGKHLSGRKKVTDNAEKAEQEGTPYDMNISMVRKAQTYNVCFSFNTETLHKGGMTSTLY